MPEVITTLNIHSPFAQLLHKPLPVSSVGVCLFGCSHVSNALVIQETASPPFSFFPLPLPSDFFLFFCLFYP